MKKIILSADSTCDLGDELKARYDVSYYPYHINLDGEEYLDNVTITTDKIYEAYWNKKVLPKTSAINVVEYMEYFKKWSWRCAFKLISELCACGRGAWRSISD